MRVGVSAAKVVATIEIPRSHHGMERPARKKLSGLFFVERAAHHPIPRLTRRESAMMIQSSFSAMMQETEDEEARTQERSLDVGCSP
ncbi:hypothetical protein N9202_00665 [bacterium]|nr:hypothetical protein [bacterium]